MGGNPIVGRGTKAVLPHHPIVHIRMVNIDTSVDPIFRKERVAGEDWSGVSQADEILAAELPAGSKPHRCGDLTVAEAES